MPLLVVGAGPAGAVGVSVSARWQGSKAAAYEKALAVIVATAVSTPTALHPQSTGTQFRLGVVR